MTKGAGPIELPTAAGSRSRQSLQVPALQRTVVDDLLQAMQAPESFKASADLAMATSLMRQIGRANRYR